MSEGEIEAAQPEGEQKVDNRVSKYELRAEIGQGRLGTVYVGYDPTLDREVAVKVLSADLVREPPFVEGFQRQLRSAARLDHASIITVHDGGFKLGRCYLVMNYVEGQSLASLINEHAPLSAEETLGILSPLAEALDYAHARGVLHGDIKPENVIVGSEGRVILTDFSIARALEGTWLTRWGVVAETPQYMSPEQATGRGIDTRSDQYSLGVLAYEMLTGRVPFYAESNVQLVHQIAYDAPPSLLGARPDLTAELASVLERALAKDAAHRFGSCSEFVAAFSEALVAAPEAEAEPTEEMEAKVDVEAKEPPIVADQPPLMATSGSTESSGNEGLPGDRLL